MSSIRRNPSPKLPPELLIGIVIALAVTGIPSIVQKFLDRQKYESAIQNYEMGSCVTALEQFNQIVSAFRLVDVGDYVLRSQQKIAECEFFNKALKSQKDEDFELSLLNYAKLAVYDNSALLEPTRENVRYLFQKAKIDSLATLNVCDRLGVIASSKLLPKSDYRLQLLYVKCGKVYEENKSYERAIFIYEKFLKDYPKHSLTENVKQSLARTTVADIRGGAARHLEPPGRTGTTVDGSTVIEIQNTSPAKMRITFSGPTYRFEEIGTCRDCVKVVNKPPELCPQKGPVGRYTLEPGQYDVAVKFTADDGNLVDPWAGSWSLEAGAEYKTCFFLIENPVDEPKKKEKNTP